MNISMTLLDVLRDYPVFHKIVGNFSFWFRKPKSLKRVKPEDINRYYVLSKNPLIISTAEPLEYLELFSEQIKDKNAHFLVMFWGNTLYNKRRVSHITKVYKKFITRYPQHVVHFLANTQEEKEVFLRINSNSYLVNHNCLLDPSIYKIQSQERDLDVIYNGRLDSGKRHYLIPKGHRISLICPGTLNPGRTYRYIKNYLEKIHAAEVLNFNPFRKLGSLSLSEIESIPNLPIPKIVEFLNRGRVGLILSAVEGANYASMEYMLCGLPVVSTISLGGRDVFFDNKYARIVPSKSSNILYAIQQVKLQNYHPVEVREYALSVIRPHLDTYKDLIKKILVENGATNEWELVWERIFRNKMLILPNQFDKESFFSQIDNAPDLLSSTSVNN